MKLSGRKVFVTGCAGFIGSHMVDELLSHDNDVVGVDNLSAGKMAFLSEAQRTKRFKFVPLDLLKTGHSAGHERLRCGVPFRRQPGRPSGTVQHAHPFRPEHRGDVPDPGGDEGPQVKNIAFPSTSTVYGEATQIPTREDYGPLVPISIYGASKLACEALIASYAYTFDMEAVLYRFANVVGSRSTHNVIHDFIHKLENDNTRLEILGAEPGTNKSYVHVSDCVKGMLLGAEKASPPRSRSTTSVRRTRWT